MSFQSHIAFAKTDLLAQLDWIEEQSERLWNEVDNTENVKASSLDRLNELRDKKQAATRWLECLDGILKEIQNK